VEFYHGDALAGADTSAPYTVAWPVSRAINGGHEWTARAYDYAGNCTTSEAVAVTIDVPPARLSGGMPILCGSHPQVFGDDFTISGDVRVRVGTFEYLVVGGGGGGGKAATSGATGRGRGRGRRTGA